MLFSFATIGAHANEKIIRVNKSCESLPGLTMTQITMTSENTLIDFVWENTDEDRAISIYPPEDKSAFVIKDKRTAKIYKLRSVEGIAIYPNKASIKEGETKKFTLVFDKMPYPYVSAIEDAIELIISAEYQ